jgi:hypothetical protein
MRANKWCAGLDAIRRAMSGSQIPVGRALSAPDLYTGKILEDPDGGERYFADQAPEREGEQPNPRFENVDQRAQAEERGRASDGSRWLAAAQHARALIRRCTAQGRHRNWFGIGRVSANFSQAEPPGIGHGHSVDGFDRVVSGGGFGRCRLLPLRKTGRRKSRSSRPIEQKTEIKNK